MVSGHFDAALKKKFLFFFAPAMFVDDARTEGYNDSNKTEGEGRECKRQIL